jgi:hypothetical protein
MDTVIQLLQDQYDNLDNYIESAQREEDELYNRAKVWRDDIVKARTEQKDIKKALEVLTKE